MNGCPGKNAPKVRASFGLGPIDCAESPPAGIILPISRRPSQELEISQFLKEKRISERFNILPTVERGSSKPSTTTAPLARPTLQRGSTTKPEVITTNRDAVPEIIPLELKPSRSLHVPSLAQFMLSPPNTNIPNTTKFQSERVPRIQGEPENAGSTTSRSRGFGRNDVSRIDTETINLRHGDIFSEAAEDPHQTGETQVGPKASQAKPEQKPRESLCSSIRTWTKDTYSSMFFTDLDRFFSDNNLQETRKLNPLALRDQPLKVLADYKHVRLNMETQLRKSQLTPSQSRCACRRKDKSKQLPERISLLKLLVVHCWSDLSWAILFRICRQTIAVLISFVTKYYINMFKNSQTTVDFGAGLLVTCLISVMAFARELFSLHAFKYFAWSRKKLNITLRAAFYDKLISCNYELSSKLSTGFTAKHVLFDIAPVSDFVSSIPSLASAPITITFAFVLIGLDLNVDWYYLFLCGFFLLTVLLMFVILSSSIKFRKKYRVYWNLLHRALSDYVTNIKYVKINGLESLIVKQISIIH